MVALRAYESITRRSPAAHAARIGSKLKLLVRSGEAVAHGPGSAGDQRRLRGPIIVAGRQA
jgi:hypothetical protein